MAEDCQSVRANDKTFAAVVTNSEMPVLVDFWAPWCGPCRIMGQTVEELAREYEGRIKFVRVNVDEALRTAMSLGINNIPTIILFTHGKPINRHVGGQPKAVLNDVIDRWLVESKNSVPS